MASLLVLAEQIGGELRKVTFNSLGFAKSAAATLGLDFNILLIGEDVSDMANELTGFGAANVYVAEDSSFENYTTEAYTQAVVQVANDTDAQIIVAAATIIGKDLMPRVAGRLDVGMAADIVEMLDDGTFKRPVWAGAAIAHIRVETERKVVTLRHTAFNPAEPSGGESNVETVDLDLDEDAIEKVNYMELEATESERPDLTEADVVVSGGRAMKDAAGVEMIESLADTLGAAMGASRAACDAGLVPNDLQVGQTGKVVAPNLYFAIGISGAIQHLAGMKSSKVIVAINKDPEAPIFQVADYGLVDDMFKVVPELEEKIKAG
ncbi:MAG: electron transfer flavoprotein subunit alpha/FixB family protein [Deltaproteobacteria bacterium]|nr:MAG: electron transfer flavoprotein subunit alpha/FixB family protein [Deltaproteobacteria bacterium]